QSSLSTNDTVNLSDTMDNSQAGNESVNLILASYLNLKDALAKDDSEMAASSAKEVETALTSFDKNSLTAEQAKVFDDIQSDAKEHAEHISSNGGNIKHQREHFESLSTDMYDLIKSTGATGKTLYVDHCPMYNNNKGANWISQTKDISNPYLGKAMPDCGVVKEELK
ncbi:MAG: DUF3347 domain-containing protein, partial [Daejeonella sp.]